MKTSSITWATLWMVTSVVGATSVQAQEEDFFIRDKYQAVTERGQPEYDPLPIILGAFEANSEVGFGAGTTSNLFATQDNEVDDIYVGVVPQINLSSTWSRHALGLSGAIDHLEFSDVDSESRTNIRLGADGRLDASSNLAIFGAIRAEDIAEPRSNVASIQDASEPVDVTQLGGEAGLEYQAGRLKLRGALGLETYDFDDIQLNSGLIQDQDFRDRDVTSATARVSYAVERDWALFAEAIQTDSDYDAPNIFNAFNRDSSGTIVRVGTDFELKSLIRGDIGVGYQQFEYDDPTFVDVDGLSVAANLQWFVTQLTTISGGAQRAVIDPGLANTSSAIQSSASVRADHELRRNLVITGGASFTNFEFENFNREDDRLNLSAGAIWKLNRNIWVDGAIELTDQSSDVQEFTENRFLIGIRIFP